MRKFAVLSEVELDLSRFGAALFFDEPKPHGFWLAKNWGVFQNVPLLLEKAVLAPKPGVLKHKLAILSAETNSVPWCPVTHLFSVDLPTSRSSATCCRESPLVRAI